VLWSRYLSFGDLVSDGTLGKNPLLRAISQPGVGSLLAPASPLVMAGVDGPRPAPVIGADTASVLTGLLGLTQADVRALAERGIVGGPSDPDQPAAVPRPR
jgi:2-methylfumaryl-CoA isomerase